jgi:hypothetical protein
MKKTKYSRKQIENNEKKKEMFSVLSSIPRPTSKLGAFVPLDLSCTVPCYCESAFLLFTFLDDEG